MSVKSLLLSINVVWWVCIGLAAFVLLVVIPVVYIFSRRHTKKQQEQKQKLVRNESEHFVWRRQPPPKVKQISSEDKPSQLSEVTVEDV